MAEESLDGPEYEKLGKNRRHEGFSRAEVLNELSPPVDKYNLVYLSFMSGGIGFLLPYNSFIMSVDYFKSKYPDSPVVFDMSSVYIITALITVFGNNMLVEMFSLHSRIFFGYVVSIITLLLVMSCEVYYEVFETRGSYTANLIAVAVVAIGCTVQQSSFYGYASMLPPQYTHAVMVGESVAGVGTSLVRITTRFFIKDLRQSTIDFLLVSITTVGLCALIYPRIRKTDFVQFYLGLCEREKTKITLEPKEDAGLIEVQDSRYGILKIQTSPPPASSNVMSFSNPVYEPSDTAVRPTYKVEDVLIASGGLTVTNTDRFGWSSFKEGMRARWTVIQKIYPYMVSIFLVYFTTLCLYPGITSEVVSCHMGQWMPMLMMIDFNCADVIGKLMASTRYWTGPRLLKCSIARLTIIPAMALCAVPPLTNFGFLSSDLLAFGYSIILGLSNGILGSVPMIQGPTKVPRCYRELAGNMMTLYYMWGLATGSVGAYALEKILRPMKVHRYCDNRPDKYIRIDLSKSTNLTDLTTLTTASTSTIVATILSNLSTMNTTETI
ncbi:equilibrative nucleoside transporter 4 isoform X1 [Diorhabda sublineata]|uniref:equilibrative nucleoside transporter 4 isoform X1 n=1 Tax=Diorhabda sublineata TaxID=1163346 RepID=UPI0024E14AF4|nr:equilibrative nucleoside transporter 4 isoform X1 [Diorhabda sublineata]